MRETIKSIESKEFVESSDFIESIESIQFIEPIECIVLVRADFKNCVFLCPEVLFEYRFSGFWIIFRPWDPSRKFKHIVRINLVQSSASELREVSSYDHLKVQNMKFGISRRQHLLRFMYRLGLDIQ